MPPAEPSKMRVLGEFGGLGVIVKGHPWQAGKPGAGYRDVSLEEFPKTYSDLVHALKDLESQGPRWLDLYANYGCRAGAERPDDLRSEGHKDPG